MAKATPTPIVCSPSSSPPKPIPVRWPVLTLLCCTLWLAACAEKKAEKPKTAPAVPVTVATATQRTVPVQIRTIGTVEADATVGIKPRIMGELMEVHFKEGDDVKRGDLLFTIDPRPSQAALAEAQARLARDTALAKNAEMDAKRYAELVQKNYVSQEKYNEVRSNAEALKATLNADQAAVESARLQLSYCYMYAPISGRTGNLLADAGNTIKANPDDPIVILRQIEPIQVSFAVPEKHLGEIQRFAAAGTLPVEVHIPGDSGPLIKGRLTFIDNAVNTATGTILLKATHENIERRLWPGQFVDVALTLTEQPNAVLIPSAAIQSGQQGTYVFVVKPDMSVEIRSLMISFYIDQEAVVNSGLEAGETVATDGQLRLAPGARIEVKEGCQIAGPPLMNIAEPFIRRPVATTLIMLAILIFGIMGYRRLPVSDLPNVDFPTILVSASLPGASPETMASAVATPLEKEFSTIAGLDSMSSTNLLGNSQITLQFNLSRNLDAAAQDVQAAIARSQKQLPRDMPSPPSYKKVNPADQPILYLALTSPTCPSTAWMNTGRPSWPSGFPPSLA